MGIWWWPYGKWREIYERIHSHTLHIRLLLSRAFVFHLFKIACNTLYDVCVCGSWVRISVSTSIHCPMGHPLPLSSRYTLVAAKVTQTTWNELDRRSYTPYIIRCIQMQKRMTSSSSSSRKRTKQCTICWLFGNIKWQKLENTPFPLCVNVNEWRKGFWFRVDYNILYMLSFPFLSSSLLRSPKPFHIFSVDRDFFDGKIESFGFVVEKFFWIFSCGDREMWKSTASIDCSSLVNCDLCWFCHVSMNELRIYD